MDTKLWEGLNRVKKSVSMLSEVTGISVKRLEEIIKTGECSIKEEIILRVNF